jgi:hypothetical protein
VLLAAQPAPSQASLDFHRRALVVDGHVPLINAVFNQGIDPWQPQKTGTFDYARAQQGGLDVVVEQLYVEDAYNQYNYTTKQACRLIETFYRVAEAPRPMELARTSADAQDSRSALAVILAREEARHGGRPRRTRLPPAWGGCSSSRTGDDERRLMPTARAVGGLSEHGREVNRR